MTVARKRRRKGREYGSGNKRKESTVVVESKGKSESTVVVESKGKRAR
jgi:hypothetical protein